MDIRPLAVVEATSLHQELQEPPLRKQVILDMQPILIRNGFRANSPQPEAGGSVYQGTTYSASYSDVAPGAKGAGPTIVNCDVVVTSKRIDVTFRELTRKGDAFADPPPRADELRRAATEIEQFLRARYPRAVVSIWIAPEAVHKTE